jgi:general secretion pathway protein E
MQLPFNFANEHGVVFEESSEGKWILFHRPVLNFSILAELRRLSQAPFILEEISEDQFKTKLTSIYQSKINLVDSQLSIEGDLDLSSYANQLPKKQDLLDLQDDAPVIRLINAMFTQAIKQNASDIHIETYENNMLVRLRIDGVLQEILDIQRAAAPFIVSRIKIMAKLDIAEKRIPQDGRISLILGGHAVDVRVSTLPANHGERVVLRLLDKQALQLNLESLGMDATLVAEIRKMIAAPHGIVIVTGPTGSGKSTTLYAMLTELNTPDFNILTIEDPIEYDIEGIGQTQVNTKTHMTFAKGLRAILRQDPDVVMIGEIRDKETAEIAIQASLTGHLVLTTLHTNTALGAITRLIDMGLEPFLLASSLHGLLAQRLVRTLCNKCKKWEPATPEELTIMNLKKVVKICRSVGCQHCHNTGYKGRTSIYEWISVTEELRSMIHKHEAEQEMEKYIRKYNKSIKTIGIEKVISGVTTLSEMLRVIV